MRALAVRALAIAALFCLPGPAGVLRAAEHQSPAVRAAERAKTSVVTIHTHGTKVQRYEPRIFRWPPGRGELPGFEDLLPPQMRRAQPRRAQAERTGAGVIIDVEGHILTSADLARAGEEVQVTLPDGQSLAAEVTGTDDGIGVALLSLKEPPDGLRPAALGNSDALQVGQTVLAVGSPPGLPLSVASGIVSALDRSGVEAAPYGSLIQTDMALPGGYAGGPLVNLPGETVGINLGGTEGGHGPGVAFAVPINVVQQALDDLLAGRKVSRGYLGVYISNLGPDMAESFGLKDRQGVLIQQVISGSPADDAGMEAGDIVLEFDGRPMHTAQDLRRAAAATEPGTSVRVTIWRDGGELTVTVTIGSRDAEPTAAETDWMGLSVQELTPDLADSFSEEDLRGVLVADVEPGAPAARAQVSAGDVIISVNQEPVPDVRAYREQVTKAADEQRALLRIYDADLGHRRFVVVRK